MIIEIMMMFVVCEIAIDELNLLGKNQNAQRVPQENLWAHRDRASFTVSRVHRQVCPAGPKIPAPPRARPPPCIVE